MSKFKSFVEQYIALAKGDTEEVEGQKVYRKVNSAVTSHIAVFKGELVEAEDKVSEAQEAYTKALYNDGQLTNRGGAFDNKTYINHLFNCKNELTSAEEKLENLQEKISTLEECLEEINTNPTKKD